MKKILFLLAILLPAGCSLTENSAMDTMETGVPRLLISATNTGLLSHLQANDWSPQRQILESKRYLYFLSDRSFQGVDICGNMASTGPGTNGLFRAEALSPVIYSNLECVYSFPPGSRVKNVVVTTKHGSFFNPQAPLFYATFSPDQISPFTIVKHYADQVGYQTTSAGFSSPYDVQLSGYTEVSTNLAITNGFVFVTFVTNIPLRGDTKVLKAFMVPVLQSGPLLPVPGNAFPLEHVITSKLAISSLINDPWPLRLPSRMEPGKTVFGFVFTYGEILCLDLNLNMRTITDFLSIDRNLLQFFSDPAQALRDERVLPLFWITHYPGTADRTPSVDPATGLYFASDRAGRGFFDLYFVPKEVLTSPPSIQIPDVQGLTNR